MPGVITRRRRAVHGKAAASSTPAAAVDSYSAVSKLQLVGQEKPEKTASATARTSNIEIVLPTRKRKVQDDAESAFKKLRREPEPQPAAPATPVSKKNKTVRIFEPEAAPSTPSSGRKRRFESDETSQAQVLLQRLNLESPALKRNKTTVHRRAPKTDFDLPRELNDLLDLHAAFLKTLSMQYAHNGTTSPVDLAVLCPSVTRAWGKRHVMLHDLQRCIGVLGWNPSVKSGAGGKTQPKAPFFLCDYGREKICLEFHPDAERGPLREHKLNMDFEANLRTLWLSRHGDLPATIFIGTLPKAPIKPAPGRGGVNPLLVSRNQTTLDAFKADLAKKKQDQEQQKQESKKMAQQATAAQTTGAKLSLLDRIRLKEASSSQVRSEPSPAELQRRAALQRAADVAGVVGMLCRATTGAQARVSFTMAALVARLRDSMRSTPVSAEDAAVCVRLLATEVAPRWLRVVTVGGKENVVVQCVFEPAKADVERRVGELLG